MPAQHLKRRNEEIASKLELPYGHTLTDLHVGKQQYFLLTYALDGFAYVHRGTAQAGRKKHMRGLIQVSAIPTPIRARDTSWLTRVPEKFLNAVIVKDDLVAPLDRHDDALSGLYFPVLDRLKRAISSVLCADRGHEAREMSRHVRALKHRRKYASTTGSLWKLNGEVYELNYPNAGSTHLTHLVGDQPSTWRSREELIVYGRCMFPLPSPA